MVTDDGITTFVNEEQLLKAHLPIAVIEEGIIICFNLSNPLKQKSLISFCFNNKSCNISSLSLFAAILSDDK